MGLDGLTGAERYLTATDAIYAAASDPGLWGNALSVTASLLGGNGATLESHAQMPRKLESFLSAGMPAEGDIVIAERIAGHIRRALDIEARLAYATDGVCRAALDRLNIGVVAVAKSGAVLYANRQAVELCGDNSALSLGRSLSSNSSDRTRLQRVLADGGVTIVGLDTGRPLSVAVVPQSASQPATDSPGHGAARLVCSVDLDESDDNFLTVHLVQIVSGFAPNHLHADLLR